MAKDILRKMYRAGRAGISPDSRLAASKAIAIHLTQYLQGIGGLGGGGLNKDNLVVAGYWPTGAEMSLVPFYRRLEKQVAAGANIHLALPRVVPDSKVLEFLPWRWGDPLIEGDYGISRPLDGLPPVIPDVVLCPCLSVDSRGIRLGQGGGYYDQTLSTLKAQRPNLIALAITYDECVKDAPLPVEPHDYPMQGYVTESGVTLI